MAATSRTVRVNELIKRELGLIFEREVAPGFPGALVTVTEVNISPDLRNAGVYISVFGGDEKRQEIMQFLIQNRKRLQKELAKNITLRYTPVLRFRDDNTAETADRVLSILDAIEIPEEDE